MDALVHVLVDEVLILYCHENRDCQEPDDRHSERPHIGSELLHQLMFSMRVSRSNVFAMTKMMFASWHNLSIIVFLDLLLLGLLFRMFLNDSS